MTGDLKCNSCGYLVAKLYQLVVPDGPEDAMVLMVCHDCYPQPGDEENEPI